jgi:hypothetical protein
MYVFVYVNDVIFNNRNFSKNKNNLKNVIVIYVVLNLIINEV